MGEITREPRRKARAGAWALGLAAALASAAAPSTAQAQQRSFYLDRLFMAGAPEDTIGMWRPQMGEKTRFYGQAGLGFSYDGFRAENYVKEPKIRSGLPTPLRPQLITYLDVGAEILDRFAFQVELPVIVFQSGAGTSTKVVTTAIAVKAAAPMDTRLDFRAILYRNDTRSFKLGAEAAVWIPTGNSDSFGGDGAASGGFSLSAEIDLKKVFFVFNTGPQFRPSGGTGDFSLASEWRYAAGAFLPMRDGAFRLGAQIFGSVGFGQKDPSAYTAPNTPLEWLAEARIATDAKKRGWVSFGGGTRLTSGYAPDFRVVALAGYSFPVADTEPPSPGKRFKTERYKEHGADTDHDGIPDDIDLCPTDPEDGKPPNPDDGCPALADRDGDGIPDVNDKCPDQPEDFDGIDDADGCPEDDADKDGIADAQDACPKEPGEADPDPKKNGCPKFIRRITGSSEIQILKTIEFATGKATILAKSYPILDEVVRLVKVNPDIAHLDIEGHTDNKGSDDLNERLSNDRAHAVMKYMVEHGVEEGRLSAAGYGPKRPIADNNTADGRQRNRRVEFHIVNKLDPAKPEAGGLAPGSSEGGKDAPPP